MTQPQKNTPPPGRFLLADDNEHITCDCPAFRIPEVKDEDGETVYVVCEECPLHSLVAALLEP